MGRVKDHTFKYPEAVVKFFYRNKGYSLLPDDEKYRLQQILLFWTLKDREAWNNFIAGLVKERICVKYLNDQALKGVITAARQSLAHKFGKQAVPHDPDVPPCYYWTEAQVADWIVEAGFPEMKEAFLLNHITGRKLITVDASSLNKMGVRYFDKIKAITAAIRELLQIPRPNIMRAIMRMVPMERFLRRKVRCGRSYDMLTFKKFCEEEGFPHSLLLRMSKTAQLPMTCGTKFYLDPDQMTPAGSDEGSSTASLQDASSVEFTARTTLGRNRAIQSIIDEILHNVLLPPDQRKYGLMILRSITETIQTALAELGMEPGSKERLEFLEDVGGSLLEEIQRATRVLKDIQVTRKFLRKNIPQEMYEDMKAAAEVFLQEVYPIAAMLGLGEIDLETMFRSEPYYRDFVTEITKEAEGLTNALAPLASHLVDQVILEAKLRLLLIIFPEVNLEDVKKGGGEDVDQLDMDKIDMFLQEGLDEHDKEQERMEEMSKLVYEPEEETVTFSEELHLGPWRILAARKGSDLTWLEKLDKEGNPVVTLLTDDELDILEGAMEFETLDGTRPVTEAIRLAVQEERNSRSFRKRLAQRALKQAALHIQVPAKRNEYGGYEEYTLEEKFFSPEGTIPNLVRLTTAELEDIIERRQVINPEGGVTFIDDEKDELISGATRELRRRQNLEKLAKLQFDNYKRLFPGYTLPSGEYHEYSTAEKTDLEGTPIVSRLDHMEIKRLALTGMFHGTNFSHVERIQEDARLELERREHEEVQAQLQQQIFQRKFPGKVVLGEREEYEWVEKFTADNHPIWERFNDEEIQGFLESKYIRLPTGEKLPITSRVIRQELRQERAKRDKLVYRAKFQLQNFRRRYPRSTVSSEPGALEAPRTFGVHQKYDSTGKPVFERLVDEELEEVLSKATEQNEKTVEILRALQEKQDRFDEMMALRHRALSITDDTYFGGTPRTSRGISFEEARQREQGFDEIRKMVIKATAPKEPQAEDAALALFNGFIIDDVSNVIGTVHPADGNIRDQSGAIIGRITSQGIVFLDDDNLELGRIGADVEQIGIGKFRALPGLAPPIDSSARIIASTASLISPPSEVRPLAAWNAAAAKIRGGVLVKDGGTWVRKDSFARSKWNRQLARQIQVAEAYPLDQVVLVQTSEEMLEMEKGRESANLRLTEVAQRVRQGTTDAWKRQGSQQEANQKESKKRRVRKWRGGQSAGAKEVKTSEASVDLEHSGVKKRKRSTGVSSTSQDGVRTLEGKRSSQERQAAAPKSQTLPHLTSEEQRQRGSNRLAAPIRKISNLSEIPGEDFEGFYRSYDQRPYHDRDDVSDEGARQRSKAPSSARDSIFFEIESPPTEPADHKELRAAKSLAQISFDEARRSVLSPMAVPGSGHWGKQDPPEELDSLQTKSHPYKPPPPLTTATSRGSVRPESNDGTDRTTDIMEKLRSGEARKLVSASGTTIGQINADGDIVGKSGLVIGYIQPNGVVRKADHTVWKGEELRIIRQNGVVIGRITEKGRAVADRDTDRFLIGMIWNDGRIVTLDNNLVAIVTKDGRILGESGEAIGLFTPTWELLGSNGIPFAYVSSEGKVYRYDVIHQLRYNPKKKMEDTPSRRNSLHAAFEQAANPKLPREEIPGPQPRTHDPTGEIKFADMRPPFSLSSEARRREAEKLRLEKEEEFLQSYDKDGSHKVARKGGKPADNESKMYSTEDLTDFLESLKRTGSGTDNKDLMSISAQELLIKEKQLHRKKLIENWAQENGDDEPTDPEEYWTFDPELSPEEQRRACRMAADSILDDIFKLALTHLLLQAQAGQDTDRILECLAKIQTTGTEGLTMWSAHLRDMGSLGEEVLKTVSQMFPEAGDEEVWRIFQEKARAAKAKKNAADGAHKKGGKTSIKDHPMTHEAHHDHHEHRHSRRHSSHPSDKGEEGGHDRRHSRKHSHRSADTDDHHSEDPHAHHHHRHSHRKSHRHTTITPGAEYDHQEEDEHHTHHHRHRHTHHRYTTFSDDEEEDHRISVDEHEQHHHHHKHHDRRSTYHERKQTYKPAVGPLGKVLETDEIEHLHRTLHEDRLSNKLPDLPMQLLYGSGVGAHRQSTAHKKREEGSTPPLPHIPHPGVVAKGGLLQEVEREDVAEQIHQGKERLAEYKTRILPQNLLEKKKS